jgi:asparagine synthase (glutamine-hydrolysing)
LTLYNNISVNNIISIQYWKLNPETVSSLTYEQAADKVCDILQKNIRLHMRSDVPVGAALSGGIDSTSIVANIRKLFPNLSLKTFNYVAQELPMYDDSSLAELMARTCNTIHFKTIPSHNDLLADINKIVYIQDEPISGTSVYAQFRIFQLAKQNGIKVTLNGQGADELFAGYAPYKSSMLASIVKRKGIYYAILYLKTIAKTTPFLNARKLLLLSMSEYVPETLYSKLAFYGGQDLASSSLNHQWFKDRNCEYYAPSPRYKNKVNLLKETLTDSINRKILPALLHHEDRNSMASSIESRVPFLTTELAEFSLSLPDEFLIKDGVSKSILRKAMQGYVPNRILSRNEKIGMGTPENVWLKKMDHWVDSIIHSSTLYKINPLNRTKVIKQWQSIKNGTRPISPIVWRWINLILWTDTFNIKYD